MNPNPLVVFSGMDGAGKSTQIQSLCETLSGRRQRPVVLWTRIGYTPGMNAIRTMARTLFGSRIVPPPGPGPARDRALRRTFVRRWWLRLAMIDLLVRWGLWVRLCRYAGRTVICDRYWYDSELDLRLNFPDDNAQNWWLWKLVVGTSPRPGVAIWLTVPWDVYQVRSRQKCEPFPLSQADFERRMHLYSILDSNPSCIQLDGTRPKDELAGEIQSILFVANQK